MASAHNEPSSMLSTSQSPPKSSSSFATPHMDQPKRCHPRLWARPARLLSGIVVGALVTTGLCVYLVYMLNIYFLTEMKGDRPVVMVDPIPTMPAAASLADQGTVNATTDTSSVSSQSAEDGYNFNPIILHPEEHVQRQPRTIHLNWTVTLEWRAPDGVAKQVYLINGGFPGPVIEARSGDELVVNVYNGILDRNHTGISIHWHGLSMNGANEMDGVVGLTQCAIKSTQRFTYQFRIPDHQAGTFWYHAHSGLHRADGLYGGLIVHKPVHDDEQADSSLYQYDNEQLLLISDWYHRQGAEVLDWFENPDHYGLEPAPDSMLLNGRGRFNCSMAVKARPIKCSEVANPLIRLVGDDRVRVRVVNTGVSAGFSMSVSDSSMRLITVDGGCPVSEETPRARTIGLLYPGERMDFILERQSDHPGTIHKSDSPELTIELDRENMPLHNFALTRIQSFSMHWDTSKKTRHGSPPGNSVDVFNLADASGQLQSKQLGLTRDPSQLAVLYSSMKIRSAHHNRPVGSINHTSWIMPDKATPPLLSIDREEWKNIVHQPIQTKEFNIPWFKKSGPDEWLELAVNNFDDKGHPFHLHGYEFYVVARATASGPYRGYNPFDPKTTASEAKALNTRNPLRKDTVQIPAMGYVVIRFPLDNDGLWLLHCHVLWHQAIGMGTVLQVGGGISDSVREKAAQACPK